MSVVMLVAGIIAIAWMAVLAAAVGLCWAAKRGDAALPAPEAGIEVSLMRDVRFVLGEPVGSAPPSAPRD